MASGELISYASDIAINLMWDLVNTTPACLDVFS